VPDEQSVEMLMLRSVERLRTANREVDSGAPVREGMLALVHAVTLIGTAVSMLGTRVNALEKLTRDLRDHKADA
jgi:hypothetical protein